MSCETRTLGEKQGYVPFPLSMGSQELPSWSPAWHYMCSWLLLLLPLGSFPFNPNRSAGTGSQHTSSIAWQGWAVWFESKAKQTQQAPTCVLLPAITQKGLLWGQGSQQDLLHGRLQKGCRGSCWSFPMAVGNKEAPRHAGDEQKDVPCPGDRNSGNTTSHLLPIPSCRLPESGWQSLAMRL